MCGCVTVVASPEAPAPHHKPTLRICTLHTYKDYIDRRSLSRPNFYLYMYFTPPASTQRCRGPWPADLRPAPPARPPPVMVRCQFLIAKNEHTHTWQELFSPFTNQPESELPTHLQPVHAEAVAQLLFLLPCVRRQRGRAQRADHALTPGAHDVPLEKIDQE